jgi:hypothetical protein
VWAVGYGFVAGAVAWAAHWDGTEWTAEKLLTGNNPLNYLYGSSALGPSSLWAVGWTGNAQTTSGLIMHWDGTTWTETTYGGGSLLRLYDVQALTPNDVWAAGSDDGQTLMIHFDGATWSEISVPEIGAIRDIAVLTPVEMWAVGDAGILRWDGLTWSLVETPGTALHGASALRQQDVWAVGDGVLHYTNALFSDVPPGHTFYPSIQCLACRGILGGYADGTFRPGNNITRGQLSKVVANAAGFNEPVSGQTFEDVPPQHTFYIWIERLSSRGIVSGYPCGGEGEPCVPPQNRLYFRPGNNATRGQISKIVSEAAGFADPVTGQTFEDVPESNPFYLWIERLAQRGIMSGYPCGGQGEPCGSENRPYFRWANNATRGQTSKIVANTFHSDCSGR